MEITLTATIIQEDKNSFTAWLNEIKGVIAQGDSIEDVKTELIKVLKIKFDIERKENAKMHIDGAITEELKYMAI